MKQQRENAMSFANLGPMTQYRSALPEMKDAASRQKEKAKRKREKAKQDHEMAADRRSSPLNRKTGKYFVQRRSPPLETEMPISSNEGSGNRTLIRLAGRLNPVATILSVGNLRTPAKCCCTSRLDIVIRTFLNGLGHTVRLFSSMVA